MALQAHKKIDDAGNEENDDGGDYDDEPVFKFSKVTLSSSVSRKANDDNKSTPDYLSCIAVHERFLVIGKNTGDILITDHLGTIIPQFHIQAHTYPVNAISIDANGDYIASCCQEGRVKISGLFSKNDDQLNAFSRPIKAVCLDPFFSKSKQYVTGDTSLILNERGLLGRHKSTTLFDFKGGLIHTLRWKESLIAVANDRGVGVYDLRARRLVGFEYTEPQPGFAPGIYPSRVSWNDATTLVAACAKTIKIVTIVNDPTNDHQSTVPKKSMNIVMTFKIEFYACGLTSVNRDLFLLGIEDYSIANGVTDPSLTVLQSIDRNYEEKAHDRFVLSRNKDTSPFQFQLEYLPDERCFFILSPYDIIKAEHRNYDDHIDYLISKKRFDEAIQAFEQPKNTTDKPQRHTKRSVYQEYVKELIENGQSKTAVKLFPDVYKTAEEWEEQIQKFIDRKELDIITPYIPTVLPKLNPTAYDKVLETYLSEKKYDKLKELLTTWPSDIYNVTSIDHLTRIKMDDDHTSKTLLECSAILAEKQGNVVKTLDIYLKMRNIQVFQLIDRKNLHSEILPHIETLMTIDKNLTLDMLVNHVDILPVKSVYNVLQKNSRFLHAYLDAVFSKNPSDTRDYYTLQVTLYAEYDTTKLMGFLRKAGSYSIQDAILICEKKKLYPEAVFLYGRAGNGRVALQTILDKLNDIEGAIAFCRETGDQTLWPVLIEASQNKPEFIRGLLNHAGSDMNLKELIDSIRDDLRIPGLRDSLCKIMQDYNIQMSLSESCRKIIVHDCLGLRKKTITLLQSGYSVKDTDLCAKCHNPVYTSGTLTNLPVSVFFCLHVFHTKCIETNPDVCGVCSTTSLFGAA
ncbi:unnamed protein product [Adineta ricciae]|uniref:Vps41 beta-propeller domain-containing protein n=1 Tax=Adineta ricciae TaxID=249248 RepID=A0A814NTX2_ADIRI|nr:unnamed protein product [Adineta ricciae]CAF1095784.1 unnamed protein product [Adineta ricciae]